MTTNLINELLSCPDMGWVSKAPCSLEALAQLIEQSGVALPDEYREFLCRSNGGIAGLDIQPFALNLWSCEQIITHNTEYEITSCLPGFFAFGDNGANESLAFDTREDRPNRVYSICLDSLDPDAVVLVAESFLDLLSHVIPLPDRTKEMENLGEVLRKS
jgi:hypothetical protein